MQYTGRIERGEKKLEIGIVNPDIGIKKLDLGILDIIRTNIQLVSSTLCRKINLKT